MFAHVNQFPLCVFVFPFAGVGRVDRNNNEQLLTQQLCFFHHFPFPFVLSCKQRSFFYRASPRLTRSGSFLLPFPHCPMAPSPTALPVSCLFPLVFHPPSHHSWLFVPTGLWEVQQELSSFFLILFFFFFFLPGRKQGTFEAPLTADKKIAEERSNHHMP